MSVSKDHTINQLAGCLAMAARYAEGRGTGVLQDVRAAYRAWAVLQPEPDPIPPFCNLEDHDVLTGRFDSSHEAFQARHLS